jgi:hypothetical protein
VKWGVARSQEICLPVYLAASEEGRKLYSYYGFEEFGFKEWDRVEYSFDGPNILVEMMLRPKVATIVCTPGASSSSLAMRSHTQ